MDDLLFLTPTDVSSLELDIISRNRLLSALQKVVLPAKSEAPAEAAEGDIEAPSPAPAIAADAEDKLADAGAPYVEV